MPLHPCPYSAHISYGGEGPISISHTASISLLIWLGYSNKTQHGAQKLIENVMKNTRKGVKLSHTSLTECYSHTTHAVLYSAECSFYQT